MKSTFSVFLLSRICSINARSYFDSNYRDSDRDNIFRPSVELSQLNTSTLSVSSLPMQPLAPHLAQERLAISFDEEYSDIGNIDYTQPSVSSYRGQRGVQGEYKWAAL